MADVTVDADAIRAQIEQAARKAGRDPAGVTLLAATKYLDTEDVGKLIEAGVTVLGENRAQALEEKAARYPDATWHFIGQLQSRKVKTILPLVTLIHSVASESALNQLATHGTPETEILIQVDVAGEDSKAGIALEDLERYLEQATVTVVGLATMPPAVEDPEANRPVFRRLRELADEHGLHHCSMGTSQDFAVAVEEGATIVRVGSALLHRS